MTKATSISSNIRAVDSIAKAIFAARGCTPPFYMALIASVQFLSLQEDISSSGRPNIELIGSANFDSSFHKALFFM